MFLLDSNIFIYGIQPAYQPLQQWVHGQVIAASEISLVEVLGYHQLTEEDKSDLEELFGAARIFPVSHSIVNRAIHLRQQRKMSLGDALIAATALEHGLPLATRNMDDFDWIDGLVLHNPLKQ